jgi:hypothetical protein
MIRPTDGPRTWAACDASKPPPLVVAGGGLLVWGWVAGVPLGAEVAPELRDVPL